MMREAAQTSRGRNFWIEILIFIAVFITGGVIQNMVAVVPMCIAFFASESFQEMLAAIREGDFDLFEWSTALEMSPAFMVISLFATVGLIVVALVYVLCLEKRKAHTMGLTRKALFSEYGIGLAVGLTMFSAVIGLGVLFGGFSYAGVTVAGVVPMLLLMFVGYMIQGASEELLCRGYLCVSISRRSPVAVAILANSVLFALLHLANDGISWLAMLNLILFGVFASIYMIRRGNLWGICAIHSVWNFAQGNLFGLQVSGMEMNTSVFSFTQKEGKTIINGGAFGPEGGVCVTIVLVVSIAILLCMKNKDKGFDAGKPTATAESV